MIEDFGKLLEENLTQMDFSEGQKITGTVINISSDYVTVATGLKSESLVPISEFYTIDNQLEVSLGDQLDFILYEKPDSDGFGTTMLSRNKAKREVRWTELQKIYDDGESIRGIVKNKVRGGLIIDLYNIYAFLPNSQMDSRTRESGIDEGEEVALKILKIDPKRNSVVVSKRAAMEEAGYIDVAKLFETIEVGKEIRGVVKNLTNYGAFVDVGGIDGLLHVTDISWKRLNHPSEAISVGDELTMKVLQFDPKIQHISLGLKHMTDNPWTDVERRYQPGMRTFGTVTNVTEYGCFVELEDAIEGLVHMSEMDWTNRNVNPHKLVQPGNELEVLVLEVIPERHRISLGMKQCIPNPWVAFDERYSINDQVEGTVKSITDFGIFVGLEGGIDGLVHASDISWTDSSEKAIRQYRKGDAIRVAVLSIDAKRERISLGIKQLNTDNVDLLLIYPRGMRIQAKVVSVNNGLVTLEVKPGLHAEISKNELEYDVAEGDLVEARVSGVNKNKEKTLILTNRKQASKPSNTFGDLIKAEIKNQSEQR